MISPDDLDRYMADSSWPEVRAVRVRTGVELLKWLAPEGEPIRLLYVDSPKVGSEDNESLWAFTDTHWLNARLEGDTWSTDVSVLRNSICYLGVELEAPAEGPETARRVTVEIQTDRTGYSSLFAVEGQVAELVRLVSEVFKPNLKRPSNV